MNKFRVPWKDGQPDLSPEELQTCRDNEIGFSGAEELNWDMPDNKALVYIFASEAMIEQLKANPKFEFVA